MISPEYENKERMTFYQRTMLKLAVCILEALVALLETTKYPKRIIAEQRMLRLEHICDMYSDRLLNLTSEN